MQDVPYDEARKAWEACHAESVQLWLDRVKLPASFTNSSRPSIFIEFLDDKVRSTRSAPRQAMRPTDEEGVSSHVQGHCGAECL